MVNDKKVRYEAVINEKLKGQMADSVRKLLVSARDRGEITVVTPFVASIMKLGSICESHCKHSDETCDPGACPVLQLLGFDQGFSMGVSDGK